MNGPRPDVSVVVPTHNRAAALRDLLRSLRKQTVGREAFEVIVVDDQSTDDTAALLEEEESAGALHLRVIRRATSRGPAAARNEGWRAARAPLVAFTDDDCVATPGWLEAGLAAWRTEPRAIVQGRTEARPDHADRFGPFSHTVVVNGPGREFETCNIFYPRELLEELGGFDEESFSMPGGEDTDLAWRAIGRGVPTRFSDDALVHHAVTRVGPVGMLRIASRWHESILCFARHPELRRQLAKGVFWSPTHYLLLRAALALVLPRRLWPVRWWLAAPYVARASARRSGPLLLPYIVLRDVVELVAVLRGAVRYRTLVL